MKWGHFWIDIVKWEKWVVSKDYLARKGLERTSWTSDPWHERTTTFTLSLLFLEPLNYLMVQWFYVFFALHASKSKVLYQVASDEWARTRITGISFIQQCSWCGSYQIVNFYFLCSLLHSFFSLVLLHRTKLIGGKVFFVVRKIFLIFIHNNNYHRGWRRKG